MNKTNSTSGMDNIKVYCNEIETIDFDFNGWEIQTKGGIDTYNKYFPDSIKLKESKDCVVRAFASAFDLTYKDAHLFCKRYLERMDGRGCFFDIMIKPFEYSLVSKRVHKGTKAGGDYSIKNNITVGRFKRKFSVGSFLILVKGHALAIIDGVVYDNGCDIKKDMRHILYSYECHKQDLLEWMKQSGDDWEVLNGV